MAMNLMTIALSILAWMTLPTAALGSCHDFLKFENNVGHCVTCEHNYCQSVNNLAECHVDHGCDGKYM